jgi:hypothetical protein
VHDGHGEWEQRRLPDRGTGRLIFGVARKHEAVDKQRVLAGREQLGQPHLDWRAVSPGAAKDVVARHESAWRQFAPRSGNCLHRAAQLDFLLKQPIARCAVLR